MSFSTKEINKLIDYLEKRQISPGDAIDIIHASTPEGKEGNKKFNWKMLRFTMYLWKRVEQDKKGNLESKTNTAKEVVNSKNYKDMYKAFSNTRLDPGKEAKNLFKLVTDPRQKHLFKSRFFVYQGPNKKTIPQDHIDYLMQFPK
ncbi:MAG: hypothetical protein H8E55_49255 [Pelagibacterales bacterium]|nr:hypothetical protein [Pelagibacterales bacterium]